MYTLKGFVSVDGLADSSATVVAAIGELSVLSQTYALGVGEYASTPLPYIVHSFYSATASGAVAVPAALLTQIFTMVDWAFQLQKGSTPATSSTAFTTALTTQFGSQASQIGCGNLVDNGTFKFPEFITWTNTTLITNDPSVGGAVKLWFSDASFQTQYDSYIIKIVPPLAVIDTFMGSATAVATALTNYSTPDFFNAIQTARNGFPETELVVQQYDYVDPTNSANQITTNWGVLIYGSAGNNVDNIRSAVQAYIAANTTFATSRWQAIFPEIYTLTEFLMLPRWNDYAIPNLTLTAGTYAATINLNKQLAYLKTVFSDYDPTFINTHAVVIPVSYKSLEILVLPNTSNATAEQDFGNIFPDYINVPTTDTSFNLMAQKTRSWISMVLNMLLQAESANVQSTLPAGMSLAVRENVLFVAQQYAGITYLIATKGTTPAYS